MTACEAMLSRAEASAWSSMDSLRASLGPEGILETAMSRAR